MHLAWWSRLGLEAWQPWYRQSNVLQRQIDSLICRRRHYPAAPLPALLSDEQSRLLELETRLPMLLTALGIQLLGSPDYLLMGEYRRPLAELFGWTMVDQLWALWRGGRRPPNLSPEELPAGALRYGCAALTQQQEGSAVWQALLITQPPYDVPSNPISAPLAGNRLSELWLLARFLP